LQKLETHPKPIKEVSSVFHLPNASANRELNLSLNGQRLRHEPHPVYLGVTLDRSLTYRDHLTTVAGKVKTRHNLLRKLAGFSWGANAHTLRSAALALSYSAAEYCLGTFLAHKPCRYPTELDYADNIGNNTVYRSTMATGAM